MLSTFNVQHPEPGVYSLAALQPYIDSGHLTPVSDDFSTVNLFLPYSVVEYEMSFSEQTGFGLSLFVVVHHDQAIGGFVRNYSAHGTHIFAPFCQDGQWYALYSYDYTALRVLRLFDDHIEDWCGQERSPYGFCPTHSIVPYYVCADNAIEGRKTAQLPLWIHSQTALRLTLANDAVGLSDSYKLPPEVKACLDPDSNNRKALEPLLMFADVALFAGCYWGDDSNWKLRIIDLRQIQNRELKVKELFGYVEMPIQIGHIADLIQMYNTTSFDITMTRSYDMEDLDACPDTVETPDTD